MYNFLVHKRPLRVIAAILVGGCLCLPVLAAAGSSTPAPGSKPAPGPIGTFSCVALVPVQPDFVGNPSRWRFTVSPHIAEGVTVTGYRFTRHQEGEDTTPTEVFDTDAATNFIEFTFGPGTWLVTGQIMTTSGITAVSQKCSVITTMPVGTSPASQPVSAQSPGQGGQGQGGQGQGQGQGQVLGSASLPDTGPAAMLAGALGLTAIGYAARAYLRSRQSLHQLHRSDRTNKS